MDINKKVIVFNLIIFVSSLFFTAFTVVDLGKSENYKSILIFLFGIISFLGGGILEFFVWSANIWFFVSIFFFFKKKYSLSITFSTIATITALSFIFWNNILISENGRKGIINTLEAGYFLWIAAFLSLLISGVYLKIKINGTRI
ncbi:hypothetical protein [Chryseobacterium sp. JAH]|uniref:hypothetical protein n=1 Tax=Chryseobacterium sp. JAH TaxID=1742858 RepID=UPI0007412C3C|nr:hypothetical protein [Chryseobacterium sp. JAH]KUJ50958.1 hypothetical protein AR685_12035 [Chryseobacterium sp. JAH]